jgi:hypothetical protein
MGRNPVSLALVWLFLVISRMTIFYPDGTQMFTRAFNPYTKKLTRARARAHTHTHTQNTKKTVSPCIPGHETVMLLSPECPHPHGKARYAGTS